MARRMTKSTDETQLTAQNGGEAPARQTARHDAGPAAGTGAPPPEIRIRIEKLAYQLYQQRGCRHGDDWKDWLEAERLTIGETKQ